MIVKFLYTTGPNGHFPAVGYNTGKMDKDKGELMKVGNFGYLQGMENLKPQDYRNYLKAVSSLNKAVKKPQLHVAISAPGRAYDKHQLTDIAVQWLERMGYGQQPYLLIFHKDTGNNHIHIVSTRVGRDGKKIRDSFEQVRGQQQMNIILGIDEKQNASKDAKKALSYNFTTKAQFLMVLESMGYAHREENGKLLLFKFGKRQGEFAMALIDERLGNVPTEARKKQLQAWFHKYAASYDTLLSKSHDKYQSAFSAYMKEKFGIELLFHASGDKPPYGYTVIDHEKGNVFKGGDIMPLKDLLNSKVKVAETTSAAEKEMPSRSAVDEQQRRHYAALLKAVLYNYPDMMQGLHHQGLVIWRHGYEFYLGDAGKGIIMDTADLLNEKDYCYMVEQFNRYSEDELSRPVYVPEPYIAPDIDDEAINGRNRRRKKMARTNQR